ncbi:MAG: MiaB/RimO family radical SAM methylthiotransferase [Clostridiales Family XIII bacterium]|jgi:threonylcarbamoyladenosine tRNA methylthiotransferase MtaB|nr:MiaB/RimO family radical SAM methylthiotransferase [Clostridiales Family XIII bacterium]
MKKTIAFRTLGCRVNQYETQALRETFADMGYEVVPETERADIYVINTCTVTNVSDRKSRQLIRRAKLRNPESLVAVIGCYAQTRPEEVSAMTEADIVLGSGEKGRLPGLIAAYEREPRKRTEIRPFDSESAYEDMGGVTAMASRTRAYIKVQDGCDRFCSYCIVPYARGPARSRALPDIEAEAKSLLAGGYKELVLTGVNMALYGAEPRNGQDPQGRARPAAAVPDLREARNNNEKQQGYGIHVIVNILNRIEGDFRIRLGSLEPTVIDAEYVKRLFCAEKLCPSLHLSAQSGSNRVLSAMNRRYTREAYLELAEVLRARDGGYGISTDLIAGFPGETEEDFEESLSLLRRLDFSHVHAFPYSKRAGTPAADMQGQIPAEVRSRRSRALIAAGEASARAFFERNIGAVRRVLPETADAGTGLLEGLSDNNIRVYFEGGEALCGRFADVRLSGMMKDGMAGTFLR